jgi:hypothetical protein
MRHEFSHENDLFEQRFAPLPSSDRVVIPPVLPAVAATRPQSGIAAGCISAAAFTFWVMALWSSLLVLSSLASGNGLVLLANALKMLLLGFTAVGLWRRYRWAVHLLLLTCAMFCADFAGPTLLLTLEGMNRYMTNETGKLLMLGASGMMFLGIAAVLSLIGWWFWHNRQHFSPHPPVDEWGYRVYLLAVVMATAIVVADIASTYRMMDELVETQADRFRRLDRMMSDL